MMPFERNECPFTFYFEKYFFTKNIAENKFRLLKLKNECKRSEIKASVYLYSLEEKYDCNRIEMLNVCILKKK
jgi:hypothetical protein